MYSHLKGIGINPKETLLICQNCFCTYRAKPPSYFNQNTPLSQGIKICLTAWSHKRGVIYFSIEQLGGGPAGYACYKALESKAIPKCCPCPRDIVVIPRRSRIYPCCCTYPTQTEMDCCGTSNQRSRQSNMNLGASCAAISDRNGRTSQIQCHCCFTTNPGCDDPLTNLMNTYRCPPPQAQPPCCCCQSSRPNPPKRYRSQSRVNGCVCGGCCSASNAQRFNSGLNCEKRRYPLPTFFKCKPPKICCCEDYQCQNNAISACPAPSYNNNSAASPYCQGQQIYVNPLCAPPPCIFLKPCYYGPKSGYEYDGSQNDNTSINISNANGNAREPQSQKSHISTASANFQGQQINVNPQCAPPPCIYLKPCYYGPKSGYENDGSQNDNTSININLKPNGNTREPQSEKSSINTATGPEEQKFQKFEDICPCHSYTPPDWTRTLNCTKIIKPYNTVPNCEPTRNMQMPNQCYCSCFVNQGNQENTSPEIKTARSKPFSTTGISVQNGSQRKISPKSNGSSQRSFNMPVTKSKSNGKKDVEEEVSDDDAEADEELEIILGSTNESQAEFGARTNQKGSQGQNSKSSSKNKLIVKKSSSSHF